LKRIEMLHKIEEHMLQHEGGVRINVSRLLNMLEREGMQPPTYEKFVEAKGIIGPSPDVKLYYKLPCNEWEREITQETIDQALEHIGKKGVRGEMEITE